MFKPGSTGPLSINRQHGLRLLRVENWLIPQVEILHRVCFIKSRNHRIVRCGFHDIRISTWPPQRSEIIASINSSRVCLLFRLSRFDHQRFRHDQWEVDGRWMVTIVHQLLRNVQRSHAAALLLPRRAAESTTSCIHITGCRRPIHRSSRPTWLASS